MKISINAYQFFAGYLFCSALNSLRQDVYGKEKYIAMCQAGWLSAWITVPLALMAILLAIVFTVEKRTD